MLIGAGVVLAILLAVMAVRHFGRDEPSRNAFDPAEFVRSRPKLDAPYVATDYEVVDAMLAMAEVRPDDFVLDLGSGAVAARGLGVDIDPARVREATNNAGAARVADRVQFRRQDLFETPLREADVLTLYLTQDVNLRLRPRILAEMRPGARVVSHDFDMGDWRADQRQRIGTATTYLWVVPARVRGRWRLTAGDRSATLDLQQRYQELSGRVVTGSGEGGRVEQGQVFGDRIRFIVDLGDGRRVFEGRVAGDRMTPLQPAGPGPASAAGGWQAVRAR